ncbi:hypothetical protein HXX76_004952 [Chlamydomonas incerta]|uniref:Uncharacterized protein n=1 Tax=Chlamydomonas incerta TaxID=51695 RepID=A0A835W507_CHLIN|nr:hypothetical protein HXX76_004952 [Chlamydomonas incerta]|eukprot:KAG2439600.1 hypothetical protein HXX76_004952 [Chlamydomonas incerta]
MFPRHGASPLSPADAREHRLSAAAPSSSAAAPALLSRQHKAQTTTTATDTRGGGGRDSQPDDDRRRGSRWWGWLRLLGPPRGSPTPAGAGGGGAAATATGAAQAAAVQPPPPPATRAVEALVRGAGAVGVAYGGLWLLTAGYRAVKRLLLRRALADIVPALQRAGVTFWLDFGTLMSLARCNDVYDGDNDIDLVLLQPDFAALKQQLSAPGALPRGYTVEWAGKGRPLGGGLTQDWLRVYLPGKIMWADLFGGFEAPGGGGEEGRIIRINKNSHCDVPRHLVLPLGTIPLLDCPQPAPAPADVVGVLEHRYGPDWRAPKYASKGRDIVEHNKRYLRALRALGRLGLRV